MLTLVRYRLGQSLAVATLAAVVVACTTFAALYDRATQQALVDVMLADAPVQESGLTLTYTDPLNPASASTGLAGLVPAEDRGLYLPPVTGAHGAAAVLPDRGDPAPVGQLVAREGFCDHITLVAGSCPQDGAEVAVSEADARGFGYSVGTTVRVAGDKPTAESETPVGTLTVVAVYAQDASPYWFGRSLTGASGVADQTSARSIQHDVWLTPAATFASREVPRLPEFVATAEFALDRADVGVDELFALERMLRALDEQATSAGAQVSTGLPDLARTVAEQRDQAHVTIPLLMVQLALLVLVVFWLVLETLTEQRRPELAIALLHGRGRSGTRRRLVQETAGAVVVGSVAGLVVATLSCAAAARWGLPGEVGVELRTPVAYAALGSLLSLVAMCALAAWRVTRAPVSSLLRSVAPRRVGWGFTAVETLVLVASGTLVVAFVAGWLSGPVELAGPMLLALVVGLLLAHALVPIATVLGRRSLAGGHLVAAVGTLGVARGSAVRRTVAILTVAAALVTFSVDAYAVGSRNRAAAAAHEAGARLVADVDTADVGTLRRVLADLDPSGARVTPVVRVRAPDPTAPQTLAVLPAGFADVALFPAAASDEPSWQALAPRDVAPVTIEGPLLSGVVDPRGLSASGSRAPVVSVVVAGADGAQHAVPVTTGRRSKTPVRFEIRVPCSDGACILTGFSVESAPGAAATGTVELHDLTSGGIPVRLGTAEDWYGPPRTASPAATDGLGDNSDPLTVTAIPDGLRVALSGSAGSRVRLTHAWIPESLPAIRAGTAANASDTTSTSSVLIGLDGISRPASAVGELETVPGGPARVAVVDLEYAARGAALGAQARTSVWFADDDPQLLAEVTQGLADAGIRVSDTRTLEDAERVQSDSLPAWSLQLAAFLAAACLLLGGLVVVVVAGSTWRSRSRDLASLRIAGVPHRTVGRIAVLEPVLAAVIAVAAGVATGLAGAQITLPAIPILAAEPDGFTVTSTPAWSAVTAAAAAALVLLTLVAWSGGRWTAHRAEPARIREVV